MNVTIGADPEVFMKQGRKFVSAHGAIPGDKENPYKVNCGAVQVDGMALEFNIDPASNSKEFVANLKTVMSTLDDMIGEDNQLALVPTAHFSKQTFRDTPDEAKKLGCDPDYNAYTGLQNPAPDGNVNFRTAAGHIHIGWTDGVNPFDPDHFMACQLLTRQLDSCLGVLSLLWDKDEKRRKLYGQAGAFRPKPYGVEYRVLSNAWLRSDKLMSWVFDVVQKAVDDLANGTIYLSGYRVREVINAPNNEQIKLNLERCLKRDHSIVLPWGYYV